MLHAKCAGKHCGPSRGTEPSSELAAIEAAHQSRPVGPLPLAVSVAQRHDLQYQQQVDDLIGSQQRDSVISENGHVSKVRKQSERDSNRKRHRHDCTKKHSERDAVSGSKIGVDQQRQCVDHPHNDRRHTPCRLRASMAPARARRCCSSTSTGTRTCGEACSLLVSAVINARGLLFEIFVTSTPLAWTTRVGMTFGAGMSNWARSFKPLPQDLLRRPLIGALSFLHP